METVLSALNDYAMWRVLPYQPNCSLEPLIAHGFVQKHQGVLYLQLSSLWYLPTKIEQSLHFCKLICDSVNFDE